MTAASLIYEEAVRKSYYKLEPDSCKVKNNSPQFNVSLHVRFIRVFILMLASLKLHLHVHICSCFSGV